MPFYKTKGFTIYDVMGIKFNTDLVGKSHQVCLYRKGQAVVRLNIYHTIKLSGCSHRFLYVASLNEFDFAVYGIKIAGSMLTFIVSVLTYNR